MVTKRTLSGTYIVPQNMHHHNGARTTPEGEDGSQPTPLTHTTSPIPADVRPHVEYLDQFDLSQVIQWLKLSRESQTVWTNMATAVKSESLTSTTVQKVEKSLLEEHHSFYPCTFCNKTFQKKGSWVRHEASLHDPQQEWICPSIGCNRRFSTGNKFRRHHKDDHGCKTCIHDKDPSCIVRPADRSAWGCGFCIVFLESWENRVDHLDKHFQVGSKMADWDFSKVIQGLLLRPLMKDIWESLLVEKHGHSDQERPVFAWSHDSFGKILKALRYDMNEEEAIEAARLTYNMLVPFNSEDGHLTKLANYPDGTTILEATDESTLASDGNEYPLSTGDALDYPEGMNYFTQNIYPSSKVATTETTSPASGYSAFQLGEDTLGVDWALWPYCYEPGGTMICTP